MLPKTHTILGLIFSTILYFFIPITIFQAILVFFASVLIDIDHYLFYAYRAKNFNLKKAYKIGCLVSKTPHKPIMMIFHTIEFLIFIWILSGFINWFLYILIGILFHSLLDLIDLINEKKFNGREFSLIRFLILRKKYPNKYF